MATGVANLLGYANKGTEFLFGPRRQQPAVPTPSRSAPAGDHLLRGAGRDPLLSRHHAADRALGRRRDRLGDRASAGSRRSARRQHLRRPVGKPAGRPALSRRAAAGAAVHPDGGRHGGRRGHHPRRLCQPARRALSALPARRRLHVGAGRHPDGQDHDARRAAFRQGRAAAAGGAAPPRRHRRRDGRDRRDLRGRRAPANIIMAAAQGAQTGVKLAVAVGAMVLAFVAWSRSPTACSAGSAAGSAQPA
jgi:hypothetical protein